MSHLQGSDRAEFVRKMFGRIADRYDLLNRLMTFGRDTHWRHESVATLQLGPGAWALDLGSGTGDLAFELARHHSGTHIVAADFTPEMLRLGHGRDLDGRINWIMADALALPFKPDTFAGVVSGFLMRNMGDLTRGLSEQHRVLKRGSSLTPPGRAVILETSPPTGLMRPLIAIHLRVVIPVLGALIAGDPSAYRYLPSSTEGFLLPEELSERMQSIGFHAVSYVLRMFGTIAIHTGLAGAGPEGE